MTAASLGAALARISQVQPHLSAPASVLMAVVALIAAVVPGLWPITRHLTTIAHEGAHATVSSAMGRKIGGISFRRNGEGETRFAGGGQVGTAVIQMAGYLGPTAFGAGAAAVFGAALLV